MKNGVIENPDAYGDEGSISFPDCPKCTFYDARAEQCPAYPAGIPMRLLYGADKHRKVQPDQVGDTVFVEKT
jgi:hypothetical protein